MENSELEALSLALTRRADDLQLYANGVSEDAVRDFAVTESAILELISELYEKYAESGIAMDFATVGYFESLKNKIEQIRRKRFEEARDRILAVAPLLVEFESDFWVGFYGMLGIKSVSGLNAKWKKMISRYGIYGGSTLNQVWGKLYSGDTERLYEAVSGGLQSGKTEAETRSAVRAEMRKTSRFIQSETGSVLSGISNDAILAFGVENRSGFRYSAVLDSRVCEECSELDDTFYEYDDPDIPSLPRHAYCRCLLTPVPVEMKREKIVPASFATYFQSLSPEGQRHRLGETKYRLWKAGKYQLSDYELPNPGQRLSLAEMRSSALPVRG